METLHTISNQSKWLKEKGFDKWLSDYSESHHHLKGWVDRDTYLDEVELPIELFNTLVVEWLRVNHGIWVYVKLGYGHEFVIQKIAAPFEIIYTDGTFKSPQEAYSAAFDYIKEIILQKNLEN